MKLQIGILLVLLLISVDLLSQTSSRADLFLKADSVIMIKHATIKSSTHFITDKKGNDIRKSFLVNGKVNAEIILKKIKLNQNQIIKFTGLIDRLPNSRVSGGCYNPHHAILIYNSGELKYIDYCFKCSSFSTGPGIIEEMFLDETQWNDLKGYFNGLKLL